MTIPDLPSEIKQILNKVKSAHFEIYVVGGATRDLLLEKIPGDWDFTTSAHPDKIQGIFPKSFYDNKFGTVKISKDDKIFEITTFRKEGKYEDFRHPGKIQWAKKIEDDLARRDFTINAIALKLGKDKQFEIVDPFKGQKDLKEKIIRTVGDPKKRFEEDALRLLRAIRIATELGFIIEEKTFSSIKSHANLIKNISGERIRDELLKMLSSKNAADGFLLLRNGGILNYILPELEKCFGVEQASPGRHHIYDVGTHSIKSLENCPSRDLIVRFATLLHDIGKPKVQGCNQKGAITFYNHEVISARMARNIADRLHFSKKQRELLVTLVRWHQFTVDEATTASAVRRFIRRVGVENIQKMLDLRVGDRLGGGLKEATSWRLRRFMKMIDEELHPPFSVQDLAISGNDVMRELRIKPGPKVGQILNQLFEEVVEKKDKNTKEYLLKRLKELKK